MNIIDLEAAAPVAHEQGVPLVVDSTFATPYLLRPFEFGADIVCHSSTGHISGHGTTIGGIAVEKGGSDWGTAGSLSSSDSSTRTNAASTRRIAAHGLHAPAAYAPFDGARRPHEPTTAFLTLQGVETLSLRKQRHADNALDSGASFLEGPPVVRRGGLSFTPLEPL